MRRRYSVAAGCSGYVAMTANCVSSGDRLIAAGQDLFPPARE